MKNIKNKLAAILLAGVLISGCKKEEGPLSDIKPNVPVTVTNAVAFRPEPTVSTTLATTDSIISIVLSIPAGSGKKISAIKVALSSSYTQIQKTGTIGFYFYGNTVINGTIATFKTTLREYYLDKPVTPTNPVPAVNKEQALRYYFKLTLDDGSELISEPVRVLVIN